MVILAQGINEDPNFRGNPSMLNFTSIHELCILLIDLAIRTFQPSSLRKFYGGHHDLVDRYGISVSQMTMDMLHLS
jgi:hypothetical protein